MTTLTMLQQMQQQAEAAAASAVDMNIAQKGGGGILYPAGYCFARLVEVIELGNHIQEYKGVPKDPAPQVRIGFAIFGEGYQKEDGSAGYIKTYDLAMSANEKAKTFKLFKKLNYKGQAKTFAQLLGQTYLLKVAHYTPQATGSKPRSIIDLEGFLPPNDPVTKQPYPIPDAPESMYRLFLWDMPTQQMWDSLFMEGVWDDGKSKNIIQNQLMSATNFPGSALEQLLGGSTDMPSLVVPATPTATPVMPTAPQVEMPIVQSTQQDEAMPFDGGVPTTLKATQMPVAEVNAAPVVAMPTIPSMPTMPAIPGAVQA